MRSDVVVVVTPEGQLSSRVIQAVEPFLIQQLISQTAVEALDEGVLLRLSWVDVVPFDIVLIRPSQDRTTCELCAIVADNAGRFTVDPYKRIQFTGDTRARDAGVSHEAKVLAAAIIVHGEDAELAGHAKRIG